MIAPATTQVRCAVYTRKSTDEGLSAEFTSLDAQRESGEAYIASQRSEGWKCLSTRYDDGGFTGGNTKRPALQQLLDDVRAGQIDVVVIYKLDRLSRSLFDFLAMMTLLEQHNVSLVSVTQRFDTSSSMGRLMLNILLSFAQFEREMVSDRTRDKIAATRRKGKWTGGRPLLGYDVDRAGPSPKIVVNEDEAEQVRQIFRLYLERGSLLETVKELRTRGWTTKCWETKAGKPMGGRPIDKGQLFNLLTNVTYIGKVRYREEVHEGEHDAIIVLELWQQVQAQLKRNGQSGAPHLRNKHGAILKGLLQCKHCGCAMTHKFTTKGTRRYRYYTCVNADKNGWDQCPTKSIAAGEVERFVVEQICGIGSDENLVRQTFEQVNQQGEQQATELNAERGVLRRQLRRDEAMLPQATQADHQADLHDRIATAQRRLSDIARQLESIAMGQISESDVAQALMDFDPLWNALTQAERWRVMQLLIERVEYDGAEGEITITFKPTGIASLRDELQATETAA